MSAAVAIKKIPESKLGVSEPPPSWFGNRENERNNGKWTNTNWLKSRFHFSFAEYSNPRNQNFGVLRVMNDDLVQPDRGFGEHPHRDVEICTYVVEGKLTHKDSMGTAETLGRGAVQFMTAGQVAIRFRCLSSAHRLSSLRVWCLAGRDALGAQPGQGRAAALHPNVDHHPPTWPASQGTPETDSSFLCCLPPDVVVRAVSVRLLRGGCGSKAGQIRALGGGRGGGGRGLGGGAHPHQPGAAHPARGMPLSVPARCYRDWGLSLRTSQDANIHVAELDGSAGSAGSAATLDVRAGRQAYVLCVEGGCELRGAAGTPVVALARHDADEVGAIAIASYVSILSLVIAVTSHRVVTCR